jgi:signal transduction histidine kinase
VTTTVIALLSVRLQLALERESEQVKQLRELDRIKDEFIATASHELRTPIAAVYGAAETLRIHDLPPEREDDLMEVIHAQSKRLAALASTLMDAVAVGRGVAPLRLERLQLDNLIEEAVAAIRVAHPGRDITFSSGSASAALVDRAKLQQVLINVMDNACKYSPDCCPVEVRTEDTGDDAVLVTIDDHGAGIPEDEREGVFNRFYRLDPNMTRGVSGSGLGLYIVRGLVEAMGGRVWIEAANEDGTGASVHLKLPRDTQPRKS